MTFLFNDQSFSFETLRALAYTPYGGADIGEVTSTASRIPDGDMNAWYSEWRALAERIHADADRSAAEGHRVSARESYLRASNYYRVCEFCGSDRPQCEGVDSASRWQRSRGICSSR